MSKTSQKTSTKKSPTRSDVSDIFSPANFAGIHTEVSLTNTTTQTEIRDGKRFFNGVQSLPTIRDGTRDRMDVLVTEFTEQGFIFETPRNTCSIGHNVLVNIQATDASGRPVVFEFSGKVKEALPLDSDADSVEVKMVQYEEKEWQAFQELYSKRQGEIEDFFRAVKG